jgi:hydroxyethylthiazole kinase-like uncharacterized protein yjeF
LNKNHVSRHIFHFLKNAKNNQNHFFILFNNNIHLINQFFKSLRQKNVIINYILIKEGGSVIYIGDNKTTGKIDAYSIDALNIPGIILMENAARNFTGVLDKGLDNFLIICGKGNNGGDGYAIARQLVSRGKQICIFSCETFGLSPDCQINYNICKSLNIPMENNISKLKELLISHDTVIDAVFGTGLDKAPKAPYDEIISQINQYGKYIISVDIPSGINGSTGETAGIHIKADETVSFVTYKQGFLNYKIFDSLGEIKIVNIGLPEYIIKKFSNTVLMDKKYISSLLIPRVKYSHKGNFGHTLVVAGSPGFTGAALISAGAAVKSGSGLVTLATFHECLPIVSSGFPEIMTADLSDKSRLLGLLEKADSVAFGPGLGNSRRTLELLEFILEKSNTPVVLDADGLNALASKLSLLEKLKNRCILTPHLGEFSRISGLSIKEISRDRINAAKDFAEKYSVIILLKGYQTIITNGSEVYVNTTGNSSMANGGMGDTLTGITASLISQKYNIFDSGKIAGFLHGYIGEELSKESFVVTADDIIRNIPFYQKKLFL